jgi:dystonin
MAMLNVGQFEHALNELLAWLDKTDETLDDISTSYGDPKKIEIELAKLKVHHLSINVNKFIKKFMGYDIFMLI